MKYMAWKIVFYIAISFALVACVDLNERGPFGGSDNGHRQVQHHESDHSHDDEHRQGRHQHDEGDDDQDGDHHRGRHQREDGGDRRDGDK